MSMRVCRPSSLMIVGAAVAAVATLTGAAPGSARPLPARGMRVTASRVGTSRHYRLGTARHGARVSMHLRADAPRIQPDARVYTLAVTGTSPDGSPARNGWAWVTDASNVAGLRNISAPFHDGVATFRVPAGTYWVTGEFDGFAKAIGGLTHLDFLPQIQVRHNTTVHTTARAATSQLTITTPRPADPVAVRIDAILTDRRGSAVDIQWFNVPGRIWVSPVSRKPAVGRLHAFATEQLAAPVTSGDIRYGYNLMYADPPGIIPPQHYVVRTANLAVITDRYYQDVRSTGAWLNSGAFPGEGLMANWLSPLALPGTQTQYFSTAPRLYWSPGYNAFLPATEPPVGGQTDDTYRALRAGEHQTVDWNRYPLHPQPDYLAPGGGGAILPVRPSAIRMGNKLTLTVHPFSDNVPGHLSAGSAPGTKVTETYQIDQNGTRIEHGSAYNGIPPVTLSGSPSVVRFTLDATRAGRSYLLSTHSHTVWTWRSGRRPGATVPAGWYCAFRHRRAVRRCSVQPMMTLDYQVHRLALNGSAPPGRQLVDLTAGHLQVARAAPVTGAKAWASCDGGRTWQRARVSPLGPGQFGLHFSEPSGCYVTLRVSATDAAGGSVTETVTRGYATGH
ncbi:MAG TPA: hypothetical protein VGM53_18670 [Streptosporangiaceae bacterium]|jgi:hypothetical protein